jgi:hypothetical protein
VPGFDAELYLRAVGERDLLGDILHIPPRVKPSPVMVAAAALVAHGAIDRDSAMSVVDDYELVDVIRGRYAHGYETVLRAKREAGRHEPERRPAIDRLRVAAIDRPIEGSRAVLFIRYMSLADGQVMLSGQVQWRLDALTPADDVSDPPDLIVKDDRGGTTRLYPNRHNGSSPPWGTWRSREPLAVDTAWIEVLGVRIALTDRPSGVDVRIEELPPEPPLWRYLDRLVAHSRSDKQIEQAVTALIAAGVIDPADPRLAELQGAAGRLVHWGTDLRLVEQEARPPEPWRSLAIWYDRKGPTFALRVGAVTPSFDGIHVALAAIEFEPEVFHAIVEVSAMAAGADPFAAVLPENGLIWWAGDDRGRPLHARRDASTLRLPLATDDDHARAERDDPPRTRPA